jgi:uncharacterized protein YwgA
MLSASKIKLTDFILLLLRGLALEGQTALHGRTMAQKVVYLITRNTPFQDTLGAHYRIHYYGPYSSEFAEAIEYLTTFDLVKEAPTRCADFTRYDLQLTAQGRTSADTIYNSLSNATKAQLESMVAEGKKLNAMSLSKVIEMAYAQAKAEALI